jgi:hypothetical protein
MNLVKPWKPSEYNEITELAYSFLLFLEQSDRNFIWLQKPQDAPLGYTWIPLLLSVRCGEWRGENATWFDLATCSKNDAPPSDCD